MCRGMTQAANRRPRGGSASLARAHWGGPRAARRGGWAVRQGAWLCRAGPQPQPSACPASSFSLDSVARDPRELWRFLTQNLSLPNSTAQALLAAQVDVPEVRRRSAPRPGRSDCPPPRGRARVRGVRGSEPCPLAPQVYRLLFSPSPALDVGSGLPRGQQPWGPPRTSALFRLEVRGPGSGEGGCPRLWVGVSAWRVQTGAPLVIPSPFWG